MEGWRAIVLMVCAIITWVTEFIPIGIASCLLLFIPGLAGIQTTNVVMQNFGITTIFFMLSSGIIARAFIDCGLGYRISLYITPMLGKKSKMVLLSFMICSAAISTVLADIPTTIILQRNRLYPVKGEWLPARQVQIWPKHDDGYSHCSLSGRICHTCGQRNQCAVH